MYRPFLAVVLTYSGKSSGKVFCLVDSGADYCLMPASLGELIGIDIKSGTEREIIGIANQPARTYLHTVTMTVPNLASVDMSVAFSYDLKYGVLGQEDFFKSFRVIFERKRLQFQVLDA